MATIASLQSIDPSKPAKYPVTISEHLLREDRPYKRRKVNIQLNHKPKLSTSSANSIITPSSQELNNSYKLSLTNKANGDIYLYNGDQQPSEAVALIYDPNSQSFTLDKIDTSFRFNLFSTPSNKDATRLATQYPQLETDLPISGHVDDDLFDEGSANGGEDSTRDADPNNPYDYRHFLKPARQRLSPTPEPSPMPNHTSNSSTIVTDHLQRPSKPKHRSKPPPRSRHLSPNPRDEADADNEDSEDDDPLEIIDDSKPSSGRPSRNFLAGLNEGFRGSSEPRSLRSVASSMSPPVRGDTSDEDNENRKSDADVEEIDLGNGILESESHGATAAQGAEPPADGWDDEDEADLLEKELEQELERQADQDAGNGIVSGSNGANGVNGTYVHRAEEESSEESEEE